MSPLEQLAALYNSQDTVRTLWRDIELHLQHGYLIKTPTYIIMGKPIVRWMSEEEMKDPECEIPEGYEDHADAWYIYAFVGSACNFTSFVPYMLPYVAWHKRGTLRYYRINKCLKKYATLMPILMATESRHPQRH